MRRDDDDPEGIRAVLILGVLGFVAFLCQIDKSLWPAWFLVFLFVL